MNALQNSININTTSTTQTLDSNNIQSNQSTNESFPSLDLNNLQTTTSPLIDATSTLNANASVDLNNIQSTSTPLVDESSSPKSINDIQTLSSANGIAPSLDVNTLQTTQTANVKNFISSSSLDEYKATTNISNDSGLEFNSLQETSKTTPPFDLSSLQITTQSTPFKNTTTSTITKSSEMDLLKTTPSIQNDTTIFGEYKTTTNIDSVKSQYMPQIDAIQNFSSNNTSTFGSTSNEPITLSKPVITIPSSSSLTFPTPTLTPVTTIPVTTSSISQKGGPSVATVTPLKGSLAIGSKLIAQVTPMNQGNNLYTSSTYRPNLRSKYKRKENVHGFSNFARPGGFNKPKDFNSNTYNPKSSKF